TCSDRFQTGLLHAVRMEVCPKYKKPLIISNEVLFSFGSKLLLLSMDIHESIDHRRTADNRLTTKRVPVLKGASMNLTKSRMIHFAVAYILVWHPATVWCQQSGSILTGEGLTLDRAVMLALQNNRQVKNAELEVGKSGDQIAAFKTKRLPAFKFEAIEAEPLTPIDLKFKQGDL